MTPFPPPPPPSLPAGRAEAEDHHRPAGPEQGVELQLLQPPDGGGLRGPRNQHQLQQEAGKGQGRMSYYYYCYYYYYYYCFYCYYYHYYYYCYKLLYFFFSPPTAPPPPRPRPA